MGLLPVPLVVWGLSQEHRGPPRARLANLASRGATHLGTDLYLAHFARQVGIRRHHLLAPGRLA